MEKETITVAGKSSEILSRDFILISLSSVFFMASLYSLIAILPLYMQQVADASIIDIGLLMGTMTITSFLLRAPVGRIADRLGRKPVLIAGSCILIAASLLYEFTQSMWALVPALAIHGISIACFHTASLTYVGDISPVKHRGKAMTWFQTSYNLGIMFGPPLGLFLKNRFDYTISFIAASIIAALSLVFLFFISRYDETEEIKETSCSGEDGRCDNSPLVLICVAALAGTVTLGTVQAFLPLFAQTVNISNFALFFTIQTAAVILIRIGGASLSDTIGEKRIIIGAMLAMGMAMFVLARTDNFFELSIAALVFGVGFAFHPPALSALLVEIYPQKYLGRAFGLYTMAFEAGFVVGSMAMGPVASALGFRYTFLIVGLTCIAGTIVFGSGYRKLISGHMAFKNKG